MKRSLIKFSVFFAVFLLSLIIISGIMNRGHDNLTMEMAPATLPIVTMVMNGTECNQLHGYTQPMEIAFQRDTVTVLGEGRDSGFVVDTYGRNVTGIHMEVRSSDGSRLIENTEITDYQEEEDRIRGSLALKDLIDRDREYALTLLLELDESRTVSYYTRVIWSEGLHEAEKMEFCLNFHEKLYDREAARELAVYLEPDARLEDNTSFHRVNIHSSFRQITWGNLGVEEITAPVVQLKEIAPQTASLLMNYIVATAEEEYRTYYTVQEYYRVRYTADEIYLLDYERTMTQIPQADQMCVNDKILLGITEPDVDMMESEDGNVVIFEVANRLFSYDLTANKLTVLFSFYDEENGDARTMYGQHGIKILNVNEGGNAQFAVYGYMNRGRHEGEVGIALYTHNSEQNTVEELLYIPYERSFTALKAEMEQLLYLNRDQKLYLVLHNAVYGVDLERKNYTKLLDIVQDGELHVSGNHKIIVWPQGEDVYRSGALNIRNLGTDTQMTISAGTGEVIRPLGLMEEDIIYGVAYAADVRQESSGRIFYPMYRICICTSSGELLKEYSQPDIYVTDSSISENQITLDRVERLESGQYQEIEQDHVMDNTESNPGKNVIVTVNTERYQRYVEIQTRINIDSKSIKILTPKEVVYEGGRLLQLPEQDQEKRYYVYGPYGVEGSFVSPAGAVSLANSVSGVVVDVSGRQIWMRGNRAAKNQIMAIRETEVSEDRDALALCLDTMLAYEGISRSTQRLLDRGDNVIQILEESLQGTILNLSGCSLEAALYYVNLDIPVLALMEDGSAVMLVGFNEYNLGFLNPLTGKIQMMGMDDAVQWLERNGNQFITYLRED